VGHLFLGFLVGFLSLSEVARHGIQPPSRYKYFPSKLALYDELLGRGAPTSWLCSWPPWSRPSQVERR
jgi:hypothetical protein